jgi:FkbM family methyltransferase
MPGWQSKHALHLFEWARRYVRPGDIVWDIGANQGLFSFACLAVVGPQGRVVAFEPDPFLVWLLHRSRQAQAVETRLDVFPLAVAARVDIAGFALAQKDRALNHLADLDGNPHCGGERDRLTVMTATLDWLSTRLPNPSLVKVDVEGGELMALEQARQQLLPSVRPTWIVEVAPENARAVQRVFDRFDYQLFNADEPNAPLTTPAWNTLAIPAEQVTRTPARSRRPD